MGPVQCGVSMVCGKTMVDGGEAVRSEGRVEMIGRGSKAGHVVK